MLDNTLTREEPMSHDTIDDLVHKAQAGDTTTLPVIRHLLDQVPALWEDSRVLAKHLERSWLITMSGKDVLSQEILEREVQALRRQLQGANPSPLESLLADRICTCWLAVQHAELIASKRLSPQRCALSNVEENRLDKVHRRFLSAIRELARVRKLLTPEQKLQINVGAQQHVVNMA